MKSLLIPLFVIFVVTGTSISSAEPAEYLGVGITKSGVTVFTTIADSQGEVLRITHKDAYIGPGVEFLYQPLNWLYFRIMLGELQFFTAGGGAFAIAAQPGVDILVEPQPRWRLAPYLLGGISFTGYLGTQGTPDPRFNEFMTITPVYDMYSGLGLRYKLNKRLNIFLEARILNWFTIFTYMPARNVPQEEMISGIGLVAARIGVRYNLRGK
ncbi:hypothetical protein HPY86_07305 [candidate division WOR-3 bacterium]|jgi:hypothetical protein|nr:hypothetical protein [candidate division WOR-3 bacterium]